MPGGLSVFREGCRWVVLVGKVGVDVTVPRDYSLPMQAGSVATAQSADWVIQDPRRRHAERTGFN